MCVFMVNKEHFVMMWLFSISYKVRGNEWGMLTALGLSPQLVWEPTGENNWPNYLFQISVEVTLYVIRFLAIQTVTLDFLEFLCCRSLSFFWCKHHFCAFAYRLVDSKDCHSEELCIQRRVSLPTDGKFSRWNRGNPALWGNSLWNLLLIR